MYRKMRAGSYKAVCDQCGEILRIYAPVASADAKLREAGWRIRYDRPGHEPRCFCPACSGVTRGPTKSERVY